MKISFNAMVFMIVLVGLLVLTVITLSRLLAGEASSVRSLPRTVPDSGERLALRFVCQPGGETVSQRDLLRYLSRPGEVQCVTRGGDNRWQVTRTRPQRLAELRGEDMPKS
ncbi:hypothetical protein [Pantoea sp. 1.19]|uniref:hypothetical protein n=1 Tax=Pantoea sp. 1.19 TaxID=1925589 RepID=UPI0009491781|nr:hypothetical protein [Pantoea sp. 1.19]